MDSNGSQEGSVGPELLELIIIQRRRFGSDVCIEYATQRT